MRGSSAETDSAAGASEWAEHTRLGPNAPDRAARLFAVDQTGAQAEGGNRHHLPRDRFAARVTHRHRPRLLGVESPIRDTIRRRVAAHSAFFADRIRPDGNALCAGRAQYW